MTIRDPAFLCESEIKTVCGVHFPIRVVADKKAEHIMSCPLNLPVIEILLQATFIFFKTNLPKQEFCFDLCSSQKVRLIL